MYDLEDVISEIYKKYYLDVYKFLVVFSGDHKDAEDLSHEVFIRVLNNSNKLHNLNNLKTWILSIAKHTAIDHYRRKRFSSILPNQFFSNIESSNKEPFELAEINETKKKIHAAIQSLKPKYRAVAILRGINELTIKETSEVLQCSESKVKIDYHRALKKLKGTLQSEYEEVIRNAY